MRWMTWRAVSARSTYPPEWCQLATRADSVLAVLHPAGNHGLCGAVPACFAALQSSAAGGLLRTSNQPRSEHDLPRMCMLIILQTRGLGWSIQLRSSVCSQ